MTSTTVRPVVGYPVPDDGVLAALRPWVTHQRWYPAKGSTGVIERVAVIELPVDPHDAARADRVGTTPADRTEVTVQLLRLPGGGLLQVPVVRRPDDGRDRTGAIATLADGSLLIDGCHDPAFWRAWLGVAQPVTQDRRRPTDTALAGARVLSGEQSNTSVLLPSFTPPAILKVFRGIHAGPNPDVDVPLALAGVGWRGVPRPLAWLSGAWPRSGAAAQDVPVLESGHLGVLSELVVDAADGFELACRYAREDEDLGGLAEPLGRTVAQMHRALREALPVDPSSAAPGEGTTAALRRRAAQAFAAAPVLAERTQAVLRVLDAVDRLPGLPRPQRIHGDLHLGQVLHSADRGWTVLDFEGEPQAPLAERTRPDLALRDLAGMLRSIDYAAAIGQARGPHWSRSARRHLVLGYQDEAAADGDGALGTGPGLLLRALELDKALYEVVYELHHRPDWVAIPLAGVDRLLAVDG